MFESLNLFRNLHRKWKNRGKNAKAAVSEVFRFRYTCFQDLLDSNSQLLNIISDIETKLEGQQVFGMSYVRSQATRGAFHAFRMVKSLDVLSGHKYKALYEVVDRINSQIKEVIGDRKVVEFQELVLPYSQVTRDMAFWVGGKNANLAEVRNRAGLEVPAGFAITTQAFRSFLSHNDLIEGINRKTMEIDPQDPVTIQTASEDIRKLILDAEVPAELSRAILEAYHQMGEGRPSKPLVALRSSAIGEDSELSYAGQYRSVLNVGEEGLLSAYKEVVASLYSPKALAYRINKGVRDDELAMSVACLEMVESMASGVMYSRHPFHADEDHVVIAAVWGLGSYAVDGTISPDNYCVAKDEDHTILRLEVSHKAVRLTADPQGGLKEQAVNPEDVERSCLDPEQIRTLAGYALRLERVFRAPQDIEWTLDRQGRLVILQARPLKLQAVDQRVLDSLPRVEGFPVLAEGGAVAVQGVGFGPAVHVLSDADLLAFPTGAVLVAKQSSPKFVLVMPKAQAMVTEFGSVAGHMAAVAREFAVPCIVNVKDATAAIPSGTEVTVDAVAGRVYQGRVPELLSMQKPKESPMRDTPVYQTLKEMAELIVPLRLLDPKSADFGPQSCRSLHDLARLAHEFSYGEMFKVSDLVSERGEGALKLEAQVPLDLHIIDMWDGLTGSPTGGKVTPSNIASVPLQAVLKGMMHPDLQVMEPRVVDFSGLFSVMREQLLAPPAKVERFGDRSYAIISGRYLNFSSRVGYHYSVLDTYCSRTINKNYISFSFNGGAADDVRRHRRARAIALILDALDFSVEVKADRVDARLQKYDGSITAEKLEMLGRLLIFTRQLDMIMTTEASVDAVAQGFLRGNYHL